MKNFRVALVSIDTSSHNPGTPDWVRKQIADAGITLDIHHCHTRDELISTAIDADLIWVFGGGKIVTSDVLPQLKRCKAILRTGSGTDNVPVAEATRRGILVLNTPQATAGTVSDHAIALLLSVLRWIPRQDRAVRQGIWDRENAWPDWHLEGCTLGLIGFGLIAQTITRKLCGFNLNIIIHDPYVSPEVLNPFDVRKVSLEELLGASDFISIHVPLSDKTRHMIGRKQFQMMKTNAILINTARGPIVDENALIQALKEKRIGGAGLDVFETEPVPAESPLHQLDNVVMTPHTAGNSDQMWHDFWRFSVEAVVEVASGCRPSYCVNPEIIEANQLYSNYVTEDCLSETMQPTLTTKSDIGSS